MSEIFRVRGQVQGVGFRPFVARLARELELPGWVANDAHGVLIALGAGVAQRDHFVRRLLSELPPLARVDELTRTPGLALSERRFVIRDSQGTEGAVSAIVAPDAALCSACAAEVLDPSARRHGYAFTTCTACGPRFSVARSLPWDRPRTTLAHFALCDSCRAEYDDPRDRRHRAEALACASCGPRVQLTRTDGRTSEVTGDPIAALSGLLLRGEIVAVKGLGGYQLLVDATSEAAVRRLRERKHRPHKPLALMARDLDMLRRYCDVSEDEQRVLESPAAPIVILQARERSNARKLASAIGDTPLGAAVRYGFMLPTTPLHVLALARMPHPIVCTSGNRSSEPQVCDDAAVFAELDEIADWILSHDRPIHQRVDDSVVRVFGKAARVLRRGRGYAPAPLPLPEGFADIAARERVFAAGADLKAAVCLTRERDLVLSQHLGDLDDLETYAQYPEQIERLASLLQYQPTRLAVDNHPESKASECARARHAALELPSESVAHHHAHYAACLGDNAVPLSATNVLGLVLDGLGAGEDGHSLWGGEVLYGGYGRVERWASLEPVALIGGDRAAREPWRCLYAQLRAAMTWSDARVGFAAVPSVLRLEHKPVALLDGMLASGLGAPRASSCGRLFDAVAAALELCFEEQTYEGHAAQALEALVTQPALERAIAERERGQRYPLPLRETVLLSSQLVSAVLADLQRGSESQLVAARFHVALAAGLAEACATLARVRTAATPRTVALSGGCLQNAVLHERLQAELISHGFGVLSHTSVPANDGGLAVGQALVALARAAEIPLHTER